MSRDVHRMPACTHLLCVTFLGARVGPLTDHWHTCIPRQDMPCRLLHDDLKESGLLPVLARLVKGFNWRHQPRRHALDLVAAVHVVLRMLHHLNSSGATPVPRCGADCHCALQLSLPTSPRQ